MKKPRMSRALPATPDGLGLATCFVLNTNHQPYAIGNEDVEDAANKTSRLGTKQRVAGKGGKLGRKLKEGIGKATGDDELAGEGVMDQGAAQEETLWAKQRMRSATLSTI
jgi:uncharacterized protein YjbJ (UPF0337 family)